MCVSRQLNSVTNSLKKIQTDEKQVEIRAR
jgi:hypothetical protein